MTSTPEQLARKFDRLSKDLTTTIPAKGLAASAAIVAVAAKAGADRGAPQGGSQITVKPARGRGTQASVAVVGHGFAVLTEYGSYHHRDGWQILPKGLTKSGGIKSGRSRHGSSLRGIEQKALRQARRLGYARVMLGDPSTGFAAAYVTKHPPIDAKPYQHAAAAASAPKAGAVYDRVVLGSLATIF